MGDAAVQRYERRRHRRYEVPRVRGALVLPIRVQVLNMSLTGLAVETPTALEIGRRYGLKLNNRREAVEITVDVQWCHLVRTERAGYADVRPVYEVGLDFRHVLNDQARELLSFLKYNIVVKVERRIFGRLKTGLDEPNGVDTRHDFRVRRLSLAGMLIETDLKPRVGAALDLEMEPDKLRLTTRGKVIHAEPLLRKSGYRAGVQFLELQSESRHALERLIEGMLE